MEPLAHGALFGCGATLGLVAGLGIAFWLCCKVFASYVRRLSDELSKVKETIT